MEKEKEKKETVERQLLIAILSRLGQEQLLGLLEELGRETPLGEALFQILEEEIFQKQGELKIEEVKAILKAELESAQEHRREFFEEVIRFVDRAQKTDSQVYNAIGMNRALWYRLRDNKNARTSKKNVLKLAVILQLDYWETYYFVNLAGYSLLPGEDATDKILALCIRNKIYDTWKIDEMLYDANEEPLFSEAEQGRNKKEDTNEAKRGKNK